MQNTTGILTCSVIVYTLFGFITECFPAASYLVKIVYTITSCRTKSHRRNVYLILFQQNRTLAFKPQLFPTLGDPSSNFLYCFVWFPEIEELKFAVKDHNWPEKQQQINSLHVKYPAVWSSYLE